jgi:diguanylate cyclase (GGDEF)-like protein
VASHNGRNPVALLLVDLDHFKQVNDRHGHLVGDEVLKLVADALAGQVRKADLAGRFGGEEFVLLLVDTSQAEASRIAERVRGRIAGMSVEGADGGPAGTTVSIGIAMLGRDGSDLMELLAAADTALYRAKSAGRNRTCLASETS